MKTRPDLIVRDALAEAFCAAARSEKAEPMEDLATSLERRFPDFADYIHDRLRRFDAALGWIENGRLHADPIECSRAAWDAGLFFEVHELLEPVWMKQEGPRRELLQGLIMAGAALHHLSRRNLAGARGLLRDAARRLSETTEEDYEFGEFAEGLSGIAKGIEGNEVSRIEDLKDVPRLEKRER